MYKDWNRRAFSPNQRIIADFIQKMSNVWST